MIEVLNQLRTIGFSEKEARVYLATITLGASNMTTLATHAGLKRSNTYFVVDALLQRGFLTRIQKGKIDYFKAEEPKKLISEQIEKMKVAEQVAPAIQKLADNVRKTSVTVYEGKEKMTYPLEMLFRSRRLCSIVYLNEYRKLFEESHNKHLYEILKRSGGQHLVLIPKTKKNIEYATQKYRKGMQEVRLLPASFSLFEKIGISFNETSVLFMSYASVTAIVIEDTNIVNIIYQLWLHLWNQAKPLSQQLYVHSCY